MSDLFLVPVKSLKLHPRNHEIYEDQDFTGLADSLASFGQKEAIVVNDMNEVVAGNRRLQAAMSLGWDTIMARKVSFDTIAEEMIFLVTSNEQREKTNKDRIQEANAILKYEAEFAKTRMGQPGIGKGRATESAAEKAGISGKSLSRGNQTLKRIEELRSKGETATADYLEAKMDQSLAGAAELAALPDEDLLEAINTEQRRLIEKKKREEDVKIREPENVNVFYFADDIGKMVTRLQALQRKLSRRVTKDTPTSYATFVEENINQIVELFESWYPDSLKDCPRCDGTGMLSVGSGDGSWEEVPCKNCFNGRVGWYKPR